MELTPRLRARLMFTKDICALLQYGYDALLVQLNPLCSGAGPPLAVAGSQDREPETIVGGALDASGVTVGYPEAHPRRVGTARGSSKGYLS